MGPLKLYIILLSASWAINLKFQLSTVVLPSKTDQSELGVELPNVWTAFVKANICTLPVMYGYYAKSRDVVKGMQRVRCNFNWVYFLPYLMHCVYCLLINVEYLCRTFAVPAVLMSCNLLGVYSKLLLIFGLEFCGLVEIVVIMLNWARKLVQAGELIF